MTKCVWQNVNTKSAHGDKRMCTHLGCHAVEDFPCTLYDFYISSIIYYTYITYTHYGQVHQDLGLEDHAAIAKTVEDLAISFVLPCAQAGFPTSGQRNPCCRPARGAGHVGASRLSRLCFCLLLTLISRDGGCF